MKRTIRKWFKRILYNQKCLTCVHWDSGDNQYGTCLMWKYKDNANQHDACYTTEFNELCSQFKRLT